MLTGYWITTVLSALALGLSAFTYFFHQSTKTGITELGFPNFFRIELGLLQFLAALVLLIPIFPQQVKEWAYAGAALFYITAIIAHIAHQDSHIITVVNLVLLSVLLASNYYYHQTL